jgi:hypothetical protein
LTVTLARFRSLAQRKIVNPNFQDEKQDQQPPSKPETGKPGDAGQNGSKDEPCNPLYWILPLVAVVILIIGGVAFWYL